MLFLQVVAWSLLLNLNPKDYFLLFLGALAHAEDSGIGEFSGVELCFIPLRSPENFSLSPAWQNLF